MIRQIVVEQGDGKPDLVGLLLTSRDLPEAESAKLGERLARLEPARTCDSLRGNYKGIRWRWVATDHVTQGLEFHTIVVPRGTAAGEPPAVTYRDIVELEELVAADHVASAAVALGVTRDQLEEDLAGVHFGSTVTFRKHAAVGKSELVATEYWYGERTGFPDQAPCDTLPAWLLWLVAALVVAGVIAAIASPAFIAGVL